MSSKAFVLDFLMNALEWREKVRELDDSSTPGCSCIVLYDQYFSEDILRDASRHVLIAEITTVSGCYEFSSPTNRGFLL
ncbi:hypothetical protein TNCT_634301 [Trichonephila clavata]|uniref:Uncharacterized protein n=1 Tax=Trichonephila clavata TaxID=2740835 RepID=A0A8X6F2M4_TRICU|nr:hypothetical protein TNCT_634301 [Trichonephila clavata]